MKRFFITALISLFLTGCSGDERDAARMYQPEIKEGKPAPDFLFADMDGRPFRLSEEGGRVVVLFFWRLKCEECVESMPSLEELHRRFKDRGLVVVAVGADSMHSATIYEVSDFIKENNLTFRVLRDEDGFVAEAFRVLRVPVAYIIDKKGLIARIIKGPVDWTDDERTAEIESLLEAGGS